MTSLTPLRAEEALAPKVGTFNAVVTGMQSVTRPSSPLLLWPSAKARVRLLVIQV